MAKYLRVRQVRQRLPSLLVPNNIAAFSVEAEAVNLAGNNSSIEVILNVTPDPLTAVVGKVVQSDGLADEGAVVECLQVLATTDINLETAVDRYKI